MDVHTLSILLNLAAFGFFWFFFQMYTRRMHKQQQISEESETADATRSTIEKLFLIEEREEARKKRAAIERYLQETEKQKRDQRQREMKEKKDLAPNINEQELLKSSSEEYFEFVSGFISAAPKNETELKKDMSDLMSAMDMLDNLYSTGVTSTFSDSSLQRIGTDIMNERYEALLNKVIKDNDYSKKPYIQQDILEYEALKQDPNMNYKMFLGALEALLKKKVIKEIIEISPQLKLLVFSDVKIVLTNPEKVIMTALNENIYQMTLRDLLDQTQWKPDHANRTIKSLVDKKLIKFFDDVIEAVGFDSVEERAIRHKEMARIKAEQKAKEEEMQKMLKKRQEEEARKEQMQREQIRLRREQEQREKEERRRVELERAKKQQEEAKRKEEEAIKRDEIRRKQVLELAEKERQIEAARKQTMAAQKAAPKPEPTPAPAPAPAKPKKKTTEPGMEHDDDLDWALKTLSFEIESIEKEQAKAADASSPASSLAEEFASIGGDEVGDDYTKVDQITDDVLAIFEAFEKFVGGVMSRDKLKAEIVKSNRYPDLEDEEVDQAVQNMKDNHLILDEFDFDGKLVYVFDEKDLSDDQKEVIKTALFAKKPMTADEFMKKLKWDKDKTTAALESLAEMSIATFEDKKYKFIGLQ